MQHMYIRMDILIYLKLKQRKLRPNSEREVFQGKGKGKEKARKPSSSTQVRESPKIERTLDYRSFGGFISSHRGEQGEGEGCAEGV